MTFANLVSNQTTQARDLNQRNKQFAGGLKYEEGRLNAVLDVAYQTSKFELQNSTSDIGQRLPSLTVEMENDGHAEYTVPGDALLSRDNLYIRNALIQNFTENRGKLFQAKGDVDYDLNGFLSNIAAGVRYAHRSAEEQAVNLNKATPGGNIGTGSGATAVLVSDTGLPDRSEERRGGEEGVSTCRSRWSPSPSKQQHTESNTERAERLEHRFVIKRAN